MITKIKKIQNLGIFKDYSSSSDLKDFKQFNLIYGWNGSGKTTLSELFTAFSGSALSDFPELRYQVQCDNVEIKENESYFKKIRVFNQRYVAENINLLDSSAKPILILGQEQKSLLDVIAKYEKVLNGDPAQKDSFGKVKNLELKERELQTKKKEKGKLFTDVARLISESTIGVFARAYNKNNAQSAFSELRSKKILSAEFKSKHSTTLKQQPKENLSQVDDPLGGMDSIVDRAKLLLEKTVAIVLIERLKDNPGISNWVEKGVALHRPSSNCEFCNQALPPQRLEDLSQYFNEEDKQLKVDIDKLLLLIDSLVGKVKNLAIPEKANLYDELQEGYEKTKAKVNTCKQNFLNNLSELKNEIVCKKQKTTEKITLLTTVDKSAFVSALGELNGFITQCNDKTNGFETAKKIAAQALENHYLSEIFDKVNELNDSIKELTKNIEHLENGNPNNTDELGIAALQERIQDNKNKMSTSGTACNILNDKLKTFLGRDDIAFEAVDKGYLIKRNGQLAKNLSEGEKTAIAFIYFIIHLEDRDFSLNEGIVVIDDPISSLDSNSVFQAFAFLKNSVKDARQIFILTHNFYFLKLLLSWFKHVNNNAEYFMLKNKRNSNNDRVAIVSDLDKLLKGYDTEYQYLFKLLFDFSNSDGCSTIESVYHLPNIARKVLEYFLIIAIPNKDSPYKKLQDLADFDENKKDAIWKFTNDQSHITGADFDPALVLECKNNIKHLLEMIEKILPQHYKALKTVVAR